jgi:hypothetical protein
MNDENDTTPGAIFRPNANDNCIRPRFLWYSVHVMSGSSMFGLRAYRVQSGLGCSVAGAYEKVKSELSCPEIQMRKGSKNFGYKWSQRAAPARRPGLYVSSTRLSLLVICKRHNYGEIIVSITSM